jgi:hypothetical protein
MICSTSVQIYNKIEATEVFISRVQTELSNSVSRQIFQFLPKQVAIFKIPYLLESWELECACHPYCSARIVEHNRTLLV